MCLWIISSYKKFPLFCICLSCICIDIFIFIGLGYYCYPPPLDVGRFSYKSDQKIAFRPVVTVSVMR